MIFITNILINLAGARSVNHVARQRCADCVAAKSGKALPGYFAQLRLPG